MLVFMISAITGVSQLLVMDNYIELDEQQALKDATWMRGLIKSDMDSLEMVSLDYATGDDPYEYILSPDEEYVRSHLTADVFRINRLDLIVYLDISGEVVHGSLYDEINDEQKPLSGSLLEFSSFSNHSRSGFINLPEGLLLISSSPIVKSSGDSPARGTVVMGRFLDSDEMKYLSEDSGVSIELLPADDPQLPPGIWNEGSSDVFIETVDEDVLAGYYPISDVFGDPSMVAKTTTPRSITAQWLDSLYYYALSLLFVGLVFAFLLILFLDDIVLKRISKLCVDVKSIGQDKDFFSRLHMEGDDELSRLSDSINSMLGQLEEMHKAENNAVMKAMPVMIMHMKLDGTIVSRNDPQDGDLSVLSSMEFNNIYDVLPEDTAKAMDEMVQEVARSKEVGIMEYNFAVGDRMVNLESRIVSFGEDGVLVVIMDNSLRKAAEHALVKAKMEAESASRTKTEFLANMSHELRTPLNSILGFSDIILKCAYGDLNEKQNKYVEIIHHSGTNLLRIVNDILNISKVEAGEICMSYERVGVCDVIDNVRDFIDPFATTKNISVDVHIDPEAVSINADRFKLIQILNNLASNAVKFTPDNGNMTLGAKRSGNNLDFFVKDNGIGIAQEDMGRLFVPFAQLDSSISRPFGGTGLGLVIAKKFAEMQGGQVQVESKEGEGSTFTVSFPFDGDVGHIPK